MRPALLAVALLPLVAVGAAGEEAQPTSCLICHGDADLFDDAALEMLRGFEADVHAEVGLSCHDCHGGNPDPALAEDLELAMDPEFSGHPYVGVPEPAAIPAFCGRCHSDPAYMRRFKPDVRVDQEREYWTSQHGEALAGGDPRVATCVSCHGVHGILRAGDPASSVYPTRVAKTCHRCHADPERMAGYVLPDGRPLPVDQYARWRQSVHAAALFDRDDLSAPTCNDCHGNHGAAPPGVDSVAFVCGQCHGREALLFRRSAKRDGFEAHNEYLAQAGSEGCAACHEPPEPQAGLTGIRSFSECASCHGNHAVVRPSVAMLAHLPDTPCAFCHEGAGPIAWGAPEPERTRRHYEEMREALLAEAAEMDLDGIERFDWLVDEAMSLPMHTAGRSEEGDGPALRSEFAELFGKFRIGKAHFTYTDPVTGEEARGAVVRCSDCHAEQTIDGQDPIGLATREDFVHRMQELTAATAGAERSLLAARRGGVETREALQELEQAIDAQIQLEVLVHTFSSVPGSAFPEAQKKGLAHAAAALELSQQALGELSFRHRALALVLILVVAVLVGLALKIRQLA